jgi:hypothetical protein
VTASNDEGWSPYSHPWKLAYYSTGTLVGHIQQWDNVLPVRGELL